MSDSVRKLLKIKASGGEPSPEILSFLDDQDPEVRKEVLAYVRDIPDAKLNHLIHDSHKGVALQAIHHPNVWESHLMHALRSNDPTVHAAVAGHSKTTHALIDKIVNSDVDFQVKKLAVKNKHNHASTLRKIIHDHKSGDNDSQRLVLEAVAHPAAIDTDIADVVRSASDMNTRMVAAHHIKSPSMILDLLNDESLPDSIKKVLLLNKRFNTEDWWKLKSPHLRNRFRDVNG